MLTPKANTALCSGEEVKIGLVKYNAVNTGKYGWGEMSQQHNKSRSNFLQLNQLEDRNSDAAYMKDVETLFFTAEVSLENMAAYNYLVSPVEGR